MLDPDDIGYNDSRNPSFTALLDARLSRRDLLRGGVATAGGALLGSISLAACGGSDDAAPVKLGFNPVAKSLADAVVVPGGYTAAVLYRLGDPIAAGVPAYKNDGTDDPATYDRRAGDHHDGMTWFGMNAGGQWDAKAGGRGLLVMNHESLTPVFLHPAGRTVVNGKRTVPAEVQREFRLHGVSVIETVKGSDGRWSYRQDSAFNRRVHTLTPIELSGPARGAAAMKTRYAADGTRTRGTVNNCANGTTPWGTYLTCEENWYGYFSRTAASDDAQRSAKELAAIKRYGVGPQDFYGLWGTTQGAADAAEQDTYDRWALDVKSDDAAGDYRNAHNTYGWVVEIDPFTPGSTPRKRTALGRFGHEGACLGPVEAGKPLVWYMGDDARNEYIYKFVSSRNWDAADAGGGLAAGDKYLDDGRLYVARFLADGSGEWLELALGKNGIATDAAAFAFANQADVLIHARLAADAAGATKMDRPEWTAVNPRTGEVYVTLTNTNAASRPIDKTDAANPRFYNDPKGAAQTAQTGNPNGHIVRFAERGGNAGTTFAWDVYLFGARSTASADVNLSGLTADNDFSSPDGLWFSRATPGLAWLETDDGAYTDVTNCMLLAAVPGKVGDGGRKTVTNVSGSTTRTQDTFVGARPGEKGTQLSRFLVGPKGCEITGIAESGDGRAVFINIQHPGENTADASIGDPTKFESHWPDGGNARPRSATVVITRTDGGVIGV
ncbi:MAG: PhoX family phosphatase [Rubrivivax sp.]